MRIDLELTRLVAPRLAPPRPEPIAGPRLQEALVALAEGRADLVRHAERRWASATFAGSRHAAALVFTGPEAIAAGERFIAALPDHEFAIAGQIVADAAVIGVEHSLLPEPHLSVEVELLLVEDA